MLTSVTSIPASPIRPVGSAVNLTCTVVLSPFVDVPVTVVVYLSDPAGGPLITTAPSVSRHNYTSTAIVNSFGREESGLYTCRVSISSNFPFIKDSDPYSVASKVTIGETTTCFACPCCACMLGNMLHVLVTMVKGCFHEIRIHLSVTIMMYNTFIIRCLPLTERKCVCQQQCHLCQ